MATAYLKLPAGMSTTDGGRELAAEGDTVGEVIAHAIAQQPLMRPRIYRADGTVYAGVFLNGRNISAFGGMDAPVKDGDKLSVLPPIAGG